jgi:POT family proton-dependent oligopeptide transporter
MDKVVIAWIVMVGAWVAVGAVVGGTLFFNRKTHPRALGMLFFAEMWERFSFYGMRALLVLYMTKKLAYGDTEAYEIYAAYGALVYATPVLGGLLADKLLGYRRAIMWGAVLMSAGHFAMAFEHEVFFFSALALLIAGNGFFKPNISSLVGKLYEEGDPRRDGGFTIFYMGINAGALLAPITCGFIGEQYGWHFGFTLAGVGMLLGLVVFARGGALLEGRGDAPDLKALTSSWIAGLSKQTWTIVLTLVAVAPLAVVVSGKVRISKDLSIMSVALPALGLLILGIWIYTAVTEEAKQRDKLFVLLALAVFHTMFWAFFEQAGSSISLFTDRNVDRMIGSFEVKTSQFQAVNPTFILLFAPMFSAMWIFLRKISRDPSAPVKFSLGLLQLGLGFGALVFGAKLAGDNAMVALPWLILGYMLHTTGELCISPVGLSLVTKLSPKAKVGFFMGAWFLTISFAHHAAGAIAKLTASPKAEGAKKAAATAADTLPIYSNVFQQVAYIAIGTAVVLFIISPLLRKRMHGVT